MTIAVQVPKVAGVDSLAARLGHLLRVASKAGAIRLRRSRKPSDGRSRRASSDASSPRFQPDECLSNTDGQQASPHQESMPSNNQEEYTKKTASPISEQVGRSYAFRPVWEADRPLARSQPRAAIFRHALSVTSFKGMLSDRTQTWQ